MVEAEYIICRLRNQARDLQQLLHYLESRERVEREDFSFLHTRLRHVIKQLKETERYSSQRKSMPCLKAVWLN
jgi:hypothetical protein